MELNAPPQDVDTQEKGWIPLKDKALHANFDRIQSIFTLGKMISELSKRREIMERYSARKKIEHLKNPSNPFAKNEKKSTGVV